MKINLVAVQSRMELADYASVQSFQRKVAILMDSVMRQIDSGLPTLVAFPEYLGLYLSFVPRYWDNLKTETRMDRAVEAIVSRFGSLLEPRLRKDPRAAAQRLLFIDGAVETERAFTETFSTMAREHRVYLAAGSLCVPELEDSPHRGGRFAVSGSKVFNRGYLFSPRGRCLARTPKVNIPPGEDRLVDGGDRSELLPAKTAVGRIGTLLCFDGYHHTLIERYDSLGTEILVQPSYFDGPDIRFDGTGKVTPRYWDFISMIQGRENIQFGVAPFLVGAVFEDKRAEGLSFIARNTGKVDAPWKEAIIAQTGDPYEEAIVSASIDLEPR